MCLSILLTFKLKKMAWQDLLKRYHAIWKNAWQQRRTELKAALTAAQEQREVRYTVFPKMRLKTRNWVWFTAPVFN